MSGKSIEVDTGTKQSLASLRGMAQLIDARSVVQSFRNLRLLVALILSLCTTFVTGADSSVQVAAEWSFGLSDDMNFDSWPDNWSRRRDKMFPAYLPAKIAPKNRELMESAIRADHQLHFVRKLGGKLGFRSDWLLSEIAVDQYLGVSLNGGGAVLQSPPVKVSMVHSYRVSGSLFTKGLKNDDAWFEYLFVDATGKTVLSQESKKFSGDTPWTHLRLEPVGAPPDAVHIILRLHVEPRGSVTDIYGHAGFDTLKIQQLPKLKMTTDQSDGLYDLNQPVVATCRVSGLARPITKLQFQLRDVHGKLVATHDSEDSKELLQLVPTAATGETRIEAPDAHMIIANWNLPKLDAGFYRVNADLYDGDTKTHSADATLAVLGELPLAAGPFGWTLSTGHDPISRKELPRWLNRCGVGQLKYPCWLASDDTMGADDLVWMFERLQDIGIASVGMLDQPPNKARGHNEREREPIATVMRDIAIWQPQLEALMTRLIMRTTWWQIGDDRDQSFLNQPDVGDTIDNIRRALQGFGQPINVAVPWPWLDEAPKDLKGGWRALCLSTDTPFTSAELDRYLTSVDRVDSPIDYQAWITLDPVAANQYSLTDRVRDLVDRMITVRKHNVKRAYVSDPFSDKLKMLNEDASPEEMLLPWRTTSALIGDLNYEGSLRLPNGSDNALLSNGTRSVLVVWNSSPTEEKLYLGKDVRQIDVWGKETAVSTVDDDPHPRQVVQVSTLPTFLVDIDPSVASFRMATKLAEDRLQSLPGSEQEMTVVLTNKFPGVASGKMTLNAPLTWEFERQALTFNIDDRGKASRKIPVLLRSNAKIGDELIRFDFAVTAHQPYRFSVWRDIAVGPKDIYVDQSTRFDEAGNLIVRVELMNLSTENQNFNYVMLASMARQHQRIQIRVAPGQRLIREFSWARGEELIGESLTLRVEDRNSKRVFMYPVTIER